MKTGMQPLSIESNRRREEGVSPEKRRKRAFYMKQKNDQSQELRQVSFFID